VPRRDTLANYQAQAQRAGERLVGRDRGDDIMIKFALGVCLGLLLLASSPAQSAVYRVMTVEVTDIDMYLKEVDNVRAAMKRLKVDGTVRVMRARFAGKAVGRVIVTIEYKDLAAFAATDAALKADAEHTAALRRIGALRKIVSDSLYDEL